MAVAGDSAEYTAVNFALNAAAYGVVVAFAAASVGIAGTADSRAGA